MERPRPTSLPRPIRIRIRKSKRKHASGAGALDISLSPPCAPPHVGRGSPGDTEVDVLWAKQLGREARLRVEEDKRQHLRKA